jgi:hypothetical protein
MSTDDEIRKILGGRDIEKLYADRGLAITKHDVEQTTKRVRRAVGQLESYQIVKSVTYRR